MEVDLKYSIVIFIFVFGYLLNQINTLGKVKCLG